MSFKLKNVRGRTNREKLYIGLENDYLMQANLTELSVKATSWAKGASGTASSDSMAGTTGAQTSTGGGTWTIATRTIVVGSSPGDFKMPLDVTTVYTSRTDPYGRILTTDYYIELTDGTHTITGTKVTISTDDLGTFNETGNSICSNLSQYWSAGASLTLRLKAIAGFSEAPAAANYTLTVNTADLVTLTGSYSGTHWA